MDWDMFHAKIISTSPTLSFNTESTAPSHRPSSMSLSSNKTATTVGSVFTHFLTLQLQDIKSFDNYHLGQRSEVVTEFERVQITTQFTLYNNQAYSS